jgi:hypothetical protein
VHSRFLNSAHLSIGIEKLMQSLSYNGGRVFRHTDTHELDDTGNLVWSLENKTVKQYVKMEQCRCMLL